MTNSSFCLIISQYSRILKLTLNYFRSSESAVEMLIKFKDIETRQVIKDIMMQKFDVILDQYMREILAVDDNYTVSSSNVIKISQYHI